MEYPNEEVYFYPYCQKCKYQNRKEDENPCNKCLAIPVREWTHKPAYFEER